MSACVPYVVLEEEMQILSSRVLRKLTVPHQTGSLPLTHTCRAACSLSVNFLLSIGESPDRPARQAGSALSPTDLRRMPSGPPAGMHLINPEEITLGALVGEGGFGKVRASASQLL